MSFWNTSEGKKAESQKNFESQIDLEPIPAKEVLRAMITEAKWDSPKNSDETYINIRWDVLEGPYKKRVVFQKIRPYDSDVNKADKAKRMLAAIDANAGGKLATKDTQPTSMDLAMALCNKPMFIRVMIWDMDGKKGNWVSAVYDQKPEENKVPGFDPKEDIGF